MFLPSPTKKPVLGVIWCGELWGLWAKQCCPGQENSAGLSGGRRTVRSGLAEKRQEQTKKKSAEGSLQTATGTTNSLHLAHTPHPYQCLLSFELFILAIQVGVTWYCIVVLMASDVEHLSVCLLAFIFSFMLTNTLRGRWVIIPIVQMTRMRHREVK